MVDATGLVNLQSALSRLRQLHSRVVLTGVRDNVRQKMARAGITSDDAQVYERPTLDAGVRLAAELVANHAGNAPASPL
jgi:hypothetical protein